MKNPKRESRANRTLKRRALRKNATHAENLLWQEIRNRKLGYKFKRQKHIGDYIADFYCTELRLVIEVDGSIHFDLEHQEYDLERDRFMASIGIKVIRFCNSEIETDIEDVIIRIKGVLDELR